MKLDSTVYYTKQHHLSFSLLQIKDKFIIKKRVTLERLSNPGIALYRIDITCGCQYHCTIGIRVIILQMTKRTMDIIREDVKKKRPQNA